MCIRDRDSYEVCTFLKISEKTLQRLRVSGTIAYSNIRGRYVYKGSEIRRDVYKRQVSRLAPFSSLPFPQFMPG